MNSFLDVSSRFREDILKKALGFEYFGAQIVTAELLETKCFETNQKIITNYAFWLAGEGGGVPPFGILLEEF